MSKRISITHSIILVCLCMPLAGNAQAGPGKGPAEVAKIEGMAIKEDKLREKVAQLKKRQDDDPMARYKVERREMERYAG